MAFFETDLPIKSRKMSKKISGAEYPLAKIFSSDFDYAIPSYQRPYAWTEVQAGDLFSDLYDFFVKGFIPDKEHLNPQFRAAVNA